MHKKEAQMENSWINWQIYVKLNNIRYQSIILMVGGGCSL